MRQHAGNSNYRCALGRNLLNSLGTVYEESASTGVFRQSQHSNEPDKSLCHDLREAKVVTAGFAERALQVIRITLGAQEIYSSI